jgi:hypothetical protein
VRRAPGFDPIQFVERHGIVLASAHGPVPNLAERVAGEPIRGSWWGHPKGRAIFAALRAIGDSPEVKCFRLLGRRITFVHRRLWPALVRLADQLGRERLASIVQVHTETGAHRNIVTAYPGWVTPEVRAAARGLTVGRAWELLGPLASGWAGSRRG